MIDKSLTISAFLLLFAAMPTIAQVQIHQEHIQFQPGTTGTTIQGQLQGDNDIDYILQAKAGQSITVILNSDNLQNYLNVIPTGEDTAIFVGSSSGNRFEGVLPKEGDYTIGVDLMRPAAGRGETSNYTLDVQIVDKQASENNNPTAPYTTAEYDATTILDCEVRDSVDLTTPVTHYQHCPAGILRGDVGSASVRIMLPTGKERVLNFAAQDITTPDGGELTWGKEDDNWFVGIDNREFYVIPEIVVYGD